MTRTIVCAIVAFGSATPAGATVFSTKAAYDAANITTNDVTFDGIVAAGTYSSFASPLVVGNVSIVSYDNAVASSSFFFNTPADTYFVNQFNFPATFTFARPYRAVAFTAAHGYVGGSVNVSVFNGAAVIFSWTFSALNQTYFTSFFGVNGIGPFTSVQLTPSRGGFLLVDEIQSGGGAIPEPAAWALMVAGFGVVGTATRRRRAVVT